MDGLGCAHSDFDGLEMCAHWYGTCNSWNREGGGGKQTNDGDDTMIIKNTNERFGTVGTFESESIDELMADMDEQIVIWAKERAAQLNDAAHNGEPSEGEDGQSFDDLYAQVRDEFRAGLVVVEPEGVRVGPGWSRREELRAELRRYDLGDGNLGVCIDAALARNPDATAEEIADGIDEAIEESDAST